MYGPRGTRTLDRLFAQREGGGEYVSPLSRMSHSRTLVYETGALATKLLALVDSC